MFNDHFQFDHLEEARKNSNLPKSNFFYFKHMWWALHSSFLFLFWSVLMLIHALVPPFVGFYVIQKLVSYVKHLKTIHPEDPLLKKVTFDESID
jgi:hypothetical protein